MSTSGYRKRVTFLLFVLLLVRFWLSRTFELTGPEAYAWLQGRHLDWGFWDRGPLVPALSYLGTLFFGQTELGVRWPAGVLYAATGFLLFYGTRQGFGPRAGFYSLLLFLVLPLYFWQMLLLSEAAVAVGLMALALLVYRQVAERGRLEDWLAATLVTALAVGLSWWNLLWPAGFLLFRLLDPQRTGPWLSRHALVFILGTLGLGLAPFVIWQTGFHLVATGTGAPPSAASILAESASHWLGPKLYASPAHVLGFLKDQFVWLGFAGLLALAVLILRARDFPLLQRGHLLLLCVALPGLALQFLLSFFHEGNPDVMAALYLPLVALAGSVAARLLDPAAGPRPGFWGRARLLSFLGLAVLIVAGLETVSGLFAFGAKFWHGYAPNRRERPRAIATEVARLQRDAGASFVIVSEPLWASLLSFYLPLQPSVYVPSHDKIHSQFDLWPGYLDFEVSSALLMTRDAQPPAVVPRQFQTVRPLPGIPIPEAEAWDFFLCDRLASGTGRAGTQP
ncbi:MAG: glycosyltransferase family 39 protein [Verrucomicrobium sp.]|nr:glycosyltransferase family 39 protein [Verrucomicrobium sp.]